MDEQIFFAASTRGFYTEAIHGENMPSDAIAIARDLYDAIQGQAFKVDSDGFPYLEIQTVDMSRSALSQFIEMWRDGQERAGVKFEFQGRQFDGGTQSRLRLQDAVASGIGASGQFFWTNEANEDVPMDADALTGLYDAMMLARVQRGFQIHVRQRQMKEEIAALDADALVAYQVGWPPEPTDPDQPA